MSSSLWRAFRRFLGGVRERVFGFGAPRVVELAFPRGTVAFEVRSAVERYRIEEFGGEQAILERFLDELNRDEVVYDIGASLGLYATAAALRVEEGRVVAFEPDPDTRGRLEETLRRNGLDNVEVVPWAASDQDGEIRLFTDGASGYAPSMHKQSRRGAPQTSVQVPTRTLDGAVASGELPPPTVMKIDVEGAEGRCLEGAKEILLGNFGRPPRSILIELHPDFLEAYGDTVDSIDATISRAGYEHVFASQREGQVHVLYRFGDGGSRRA